MIHIHLHIRFYFKVERTTPTRHVVDSNDSNYFLKISNIICLNHRSFFLTTSTYRAQKKIHRTSNKQMSREKKRLLTLRSNIELATPHLRYYQYIYI